MFSDGSQYGIRRIISMFLHRPKFLKLTHVDIYILVYFLEFPLFVIRYALISGSESKKKVCLTLKNGVSHFMYLPRNGSM